MGTIYYPDGRVEERAPRNGHDYQLDELHEIVGGWIEMIPLPGESGRIMVINEDGKRLDLPFNQNATNIAIAAAKLKQMGLRVVILGTLEEADVIVGTVIVCEREEAE